jgi:hypothetical protein
MPTQPLSDEAELRERIDALLLRHGVGSKHLRNDFMQLIHQEREAVDTAARIDELSHVQLECGHWTVCTYINSKEATLTDRLTELKRLTHNQKEKK